MFNGKKIITVTPERLGDTLMCTTALHYLKSCCPEARISVIALSELSADVLRNNPAIDEIMVLPAQKFLRQNATTYDIGLNIHDGPLAREYFKILNLSTYHITAPDSNTHQAEQALQFIQRLLPENPLPKEKKYHLYPDRKDYAHIEQLLTLHKIKREEDILIGCQIGCHSIAKKKFGFLKKMSHPKIWPLEHIAELAQKLYEIDTRFKLVITGSQAEKILGKKLSKAAPNIINLINHTTVTQLYALMQYLKVYISPDTGLLHVACCSNVPLIALFGPTDLKRTGPYPSSENITIIQKEKMQEIRVEEVLNKIDTILNRERMKDFV